MNKFFLIKQPAGLGDILFLQKIALEYLKKGYRVIWPVIDEYLHTLSYIEPIGGTTGKIDSQKRIHFCSLNSDFPFKNEYNSVGRGGFREGGDLVILGCDGCSSNEIMKSKYRLAGIDSKDWMDYLNIKRDFLKESELCNKLNPRHTPYYIVSSRMGSPGYEKKLNIHVDSPLKRIELDYQDDYTLFDWGTLIEDAEEIHIEGSSVVYYCEKLNLKAKNLQLYSRDNHAHFNGMFNVNWNLNKGNIY